MSEPHLSVVISTHNRPVEVREAIAAVVGQDYDGPIETLVVWDKTEPEAELASDDERRPVRVLSNDRTPGLPGSRNTGAAAASAPVVGFGDDDDLWEPSKARLQLELMARTGAPTVGCGILISTGSRVYERPTIGSAGLGNLLGKRAFASAAAGDRRAAWNLVAQTVRANPLEPRAALALAVLLGVDPNTVLSAVNRAGRGI